MFLWDDEKWKQCGVLEQSHRFFVLRWCELFDEDAFDSWQVRTSNVRSILTEILVASEVAERFYPSHHNIKWLIEEAKSITSKDIVINESYSYISFYLDEIEAAYKEKLCNEKNKSINEFKQIVAVTLGYIENYRNTIIARLRTALNVANNFEEIYMLSLNVGIELHNAGYSIEALRAGVGVLLEAPGEAFLDRYDRFIKQYCGKVSEYTCTFAISWRNKQSTKNPNLTDYGIRLFKETPEGASEAANKFFGQDKDILAAEIKVSATDHFAARYLAEDTLESIFAVNKLYQPSGTTKIKHELALVVQSDGTARCISPNNSRLQYVKDTKAPDKKIADYAKVFKALSPSDKEQLSSALQYYKLFTLASADEARLTNLWIAVESLIQDGSKSIIERVSTYLSATNTTSYIRLMAISIPQQLKSAWRSTDTTEFRKSLKHSTEFFLDPYDVLAIFLDEDNGPLITEFEKIISRNSLYSFRVKRLREKLFKGPGNLRGILEHHYKNVECQIHRIYRARNHVTHSGKCMPGTRHLIQNLQSYFVISVHNLIHDLITNPEWSISGAFEHRLLLHKYMLRRLEKYKSEPISIEILLNPTSVLSAGKVTPAWKK